MIRIRRALATILLLISFSVLCWIAAMLLGSYDLDEIPHLHYVIIAIFIVQRLSVVVLNRNFITRAHKMVLFFTFLLLLSIPLSILMDDHYHQAIKISAIVVCFINGIFHIAVTYVIWKRKGIVVTS